MIVARDKMNDLYFDNGMPSQVEKSSFNTTKPTMCFLKTEQGNMFLGFNYDYISYKAMLCAYYTYISKN